MSNQDSFRVAVLRQEKENIENEMEELSERLRMVEQEMLKMHYAELKSSGNKEV